MINVKADKWPGQIWHITSHISDKNCKTAKIFKKQKMRPSPCLYIWNYIIYKKNWKYLLILYITQALSHHNLLGKWDCESKINIMEWTALVLFFFDFLRGERGGEMWGMIFCVQMVQVGYSHPASSHPDLSHSSHCLASSSWRKGKKGGTTR